MVAGIAVTTNGSAPITVSKASWNSDACMTASALRLGVMAGSACSVRACTTAGPRTAAGENADAQATSTASTEKVARICVDGNCTTDEEHGMREGWGSAAKGCPGRHLARRGAAFRRGMAKDASRGVRSAVRHGGLVPGSRRPTEYSTSQKARARGGLLRPPHAS